MNPLVVRRLLVDLDTPVGALWNGGDAFRSAFFNALSFSFPAGEQFFIDSVKMGVPLLQGAARERFEAELKAFIGQEATHRRIHEKLNAHLERAGLVNTWAGRIVARRGLLAQADARIWIGVTAATEHLTAVFSEYMLSHPAAVAGAEQRLVDLWMWHSAEEAEHRSTTFDLYRALGGNERWRLRLFRVVSWHFAVDVLRQTLANLRATGTLWRWSSWRGGWHLLFGRDGLVRFGWARWRRYTRADFHPAQGDGSAAERWLAEHAALAPPVARP